MATKKEIGEVLEALRSKPFHVECPSCSEEISLRNAGMFTHYKDSEEAFEVYKKMLEENKQAAKYLKEEEEKIPKRSQVGAKAVNLGFLFEKLAPTLNSFGFSRNDCRSLSDPIDYIIFEGLSKKQAVDKLWFVDIKTGGARLSDRQKQIKKVVEQKKVEFKVYKK